MKTRGSVAGHGGIADGAAVVVAGLLHRHILPRIGFRGAQRLETFAPLAARRAVVRQDGVELVIPAFDAYWGRYFYRGEAYEPEVASALRLLGAVGPALFLDCGANIGYWSARAAAGEFGPHTVIAVEASQSTWALLRQNLDGRAQALHAAISDREGSVSFDEGQPHAGRRISAGGKTTVPATTIDALTQRAARAIVKLDVEGAEAAAIAGAVSTLQRVDVAFLYEDHGADCSCEATTAMLEAGLRVFDVQPARAPEELLTTAAIAGRKPDPHVGYNFVAVTPGGKYAQALQDVLEHR